MAVKNITGRFYLADFFDGCETVSVDTDATLLAWRERVESMLATNYPGATLDLTFRGGAGIDAIDVETDDADWREEHDVREDIAQGLGVIWNNGEFWVDASA